MDPKAPKKLCALREVLRHKHCPCSEFSPLHSRLCCTAEDIWRLPFAALHRMRTMLRARAVISSCVKRMWDKGWQDRLWRREDGKRLREVHARAWWRRVQPFSEASRVFHFTCSFFYGSTGEVTPEVNDTKTEMWCSLPAVRWEANTTWSFSFQPALFFNKWDKTVFQKRNRIKLEFTLIRFPAVK